VVHAALAAWLCDCNIRLAGDVGELHTVGDVLKDTS
jgi:hypothetical protein